MTKKLISNQGYRSYKSMSLKQLTLRESRNKQFDILKKRMPD